MLSKKIASIISVLMLISACGNSGASKKHFEQPKKERTSGDEVLQAYTNSKYNIDLQLPKSWIIIERKDEKTGNYTINIFKKEAGKLINAILGVHEKMRYSYVAIWPEGLATELPHSEYASFKTIEDSLNLKFKVNRVDSKLLILKDGSVWGYFLVPKNPPESWSNYGFIYAQIQVIDNETICYDGRTGKKISIKQCDALEGDKIVLTGQLNNKEARAIQNLLETISLQKINEKVAADLIEVLRPLQNSTITSPLTVKGKARGTWFFEGSFPIKLYDASGNLLATGIAKAQGNWMTEDFVPFKSTLKFDNTQADGRGKLVFIKANPSGLEKNARRYTVPINF